MRKGLLLLCLFLSISFASVIKELNNINQLVENKKIFIVFSMEYCPWCAKQKRALENIDILRDDLQIVYVDNKSTMYSELIKKYPFSVEFFPTTYIVSKEKDDLDVLYEFQGYQKEKNIIRVLEDLDNF